MEKMAIIMKDNFSLSQIGHSEKGNYEINYYPKNYNFMIMRKIFYNDMKYFILENIFIN